MISIDELKKMAIKKLPEKIAENNVEIKYVLELKNGNEIVIDVESYGQNRIDKETAKVDKEIAGLEEAKNAKFEELDIRKVELKEIQTEMDKKL